MKTQELDQLTQPRIVSEAEWTVARKDLLTREKEFTRLRDELTRHRRALPWVKVSKNYVFDGPDGKQTLSDLFDGRSQLIVYHFMLGPGWGEGCKSCSYLADHFDGANYHLPHRDVTFICCFASALGRNQGISETVRLEFPVGFVQRERFQFRLSRFRDGR